MEEERPNRRTLWIVVAVIVGLLFGCLAGALLGGVGGYLIGRNAAVRNNVPEQIVPFRQEMPLQGQQPAALVQQVTPGSPAKQAGLRIGDLIVAVDGEPFAEEESLADRIAQHRPGDAIELTVARGSREITVQVTLDQNPDAPEGTARLGVTYLMVPRFDFEQPRQRFLPFGS